MELRTDREFLAYVLGQLSTMDRWVTAIERRWAADAIAERERLARHGRLP